MISSCCNCLQVPQSRTDSCYWFREPNVCWRPLGCLWCWLFWTYLDISDLILTVLTCNRDICQHL